MNTGRVVQRFVNSLSQQGMKAPTIGCPCKHEKKFLSNALTQSTRECIANAGRREGVRYVLDMCDVKGPGGTLCSSGFVFLIDTRNAEEVDWWNAALCPGGDAVARWADDTDKIVKGIREKIGAR